VCTQYGYMLRHNNLVNGAHRVLVRGGGILNFGMMQRVEWIARGISSRDTKIACNV
jgi:1,6-anhydro-N-acetylmuramate kinase